MSAVTISCASLMPKRCLKSVNVPSPTPRNTAISPAWSKCSGEDFPEHTRSSLPSPFISAAANPNGTCPHELKVDFKAKVPSPFPKKTRTLGLLLGAPVDTAKSDFESPSKSPMTRATVRREAEREAWAVNVPSPFPK